MYEIQDEIAPLMLCQVSRIYCRGTKRNEAEDDLPCSQFSSSVGKLSIWILVHFSSVHAGYILQGT